MIAKWERRSSFATAFGEGTGCARGGGDCAPPSGSRDIGRPGLRAMPGLVAEVELAQLRTIDTAHGETFLNILSTHSGSSLASP